MRFVQVSNGCGKRTLGVSNVADNMAYLTTMIFQTVFFSVLVGVTAEWNTRDFQRREHSLVKPYQGKIKITFSSFTIAQTISAPKENVESESKNWKELLKLQVYSNQS